QPSGREPARCRSNQNCWSHLARNLRLSLGPHTKERNVRGKTINSYAVSRNKLPAKMREKGSAEANSSPRNDPVRGLRVPFRGSGTLCLTTTPSHSISEAWDREILIANRAICDNMKIVHSHGGQFDHAILSGNLSPCFSCRI